MVTTGGLSVDPDDLTKEGIEATGARVISYGAPVFPGAMFLVARLKGKYILGAPACVYFDTHTMLDVLLPRIMAGKAISARRRAQTGLGGLCLHCALPLSELLFRERGIEMGGPTIAIRGAGEMATGIAHRLFASGFTRIVMSEIACPSRSGGMSPFPRRSMKRAWRWKGSGQSCRRPVRAVRRCGTGGA